MSSRPFHACAVPAVRALLASLALAAGRDGGPALMPELPRIRFEPQAVAFPSGAAGAGQTAVVGATVTATVVDSLPVAVLAR